MRNASTTIYTTGAAAKSDVVAPGGAPQLYPIGGSGCLLPSCNFDAEAESALRESIPGFMSVVVTAEAMTVEVWALAWDAEHGEESLAAAIAAHLSPRIPIDNYPKNLLHYHIRQALSKHNYSWIYTSSIAVLPTIKIHLFHQ